MATIALARTVDCPTCGALAGELCWDDKRMATFTERQRMEQVHADRYRKAQHLEPDPAQEAAEKAFPETEWTQHATVLAFREAYVKGWKAHEEAQHG